MQTVAERRHPEGLPGLLTIKEFGELLGVTRLTAAKIARGYPAYTVPRGRTVWVMAGLYRLLTQDCGSPSGALFEEVREDAIIPA